MHHLQRPARTRRVKKAIELMKKNDAQLYKRGHKGFYYGRNPRNAETRQQLTKRLLKQAGISYSFNVLRDMQEAGVSYTRRNIVKDAFERLGVF